MCVQASRAASVHCPLSSSNWGSTARWPDDSVRLVCLYFLHLFSLFCYVFISFSNLVLFFVSFLIFRLALFSGLINTFKWGTLAAVPIFVAFPLVNYFHPDVSAWSSMFLVCNAD